ncbi:hypothetical protein P8C59_008640 [Phyllachora maydis]|uniref:Store-operated calcium entry-associated regulatory factor n=1 Tax=Phyllachora maydis TaxID=1825666 RepID=A0AAD9MFE1_9PEZI|nr:hypothetical protein P8C59_008640 [Phyllachora maydis]
MFTVSLNEVLLLLALSSSAHAAKPRNAILLSDVQSLTLRGDKQTTHHRVPAIPQLRCISPRRICELHTIDSMLCRNQGSSYGTEDISWACTSQLPPSLKLGSTDVICEGYDRPDDPYVLKGSCGVEYRLALTSEGERLYPNLSGDSEGVDWSFWLFGIVFVAIALWIIVGACTKANANRRGAAWRQGNNGGWGPGGGWGGGPGRWDDPPPPYPGTKSSADQGWRPGFWTGLAGGAAAAYMLGWARGL